MKQQGYAQSGFTIVETLVAMTVLSLILIAASAGLLQIGRTYYKGVITTRTQDINRAAIDEISQALQFSGRNIAITRADPLDVSSDVTALCVGSSRFTPFREQQLTEDDDYALYKDRRPSGECTAFSPGSDPAEGEELLGENMRLTRFNITPLGDPVETFNVVVWVAYGDDDVFDIDGATNRYSCKGLSIGSEFCAIAELSTTITRRIL